MQKKKEIILRFFSPILFSGYGFQFVITYKFANYEELLIICTFCLSSN